MRRSKKKSQRFKEEASDDDSDGSMPDMSKVPASKKQCMSASQVECSVEQDRANKELEQKVCEKTNGMPPELQALVVAAIMGSDADAAGGLVPLYHYLEAAKIQERMVEALFVRRCKDFHLPPQQNEKRMACQLTMHHSVTHKPALDKTRLENEVTEACNKLPASFARAAQTAINRLTSADRDSPLGRFIFGVGGTDTVNFRRLYKAKLVDVWNREHS